MATAKDSDNCPNDGDLLLEYLPKLIRLAEANMSAGLKKRIDADEMANSVLGSVIRLQAEGKLPVRLDNSDEFSSLLTTIALNKIRKKARFHRAQKRDYRLEITPSEEGPSLADTLAQAGDPTEADGVHLLRILETLESQLTADEQLVLAGKREGLIAEAIAGQLNDGKGRSTKTVQRIWERIHQTAKGLVDEIDA